MALPSRLCAPDNGFRAKSAVFATGLLAVFLVGFAHRFYAHNGLIEMHNQFMARVHNGEYLPILHPGIYWLSNIVSYVTTWPAQESLYGVLSIHAAFTLYAILWALRLLDTHPVDPYFLLLCALGIMIAAPVGLPLLNPGVYNFPAYARTAFLLRNATHVAVQPYAIAAFGLLGAIIGHTKVFSWKSGLAAGILLWISALMKPSFALTIIPAILLYAFARPEYSSKDRARIIAILLPAALLILGQFYIGFVYNPLAAQTIHVMFKPWAVWSVNNQYPLLSLLLAIAFPAWVLIFRKNTLSAPTIIAWVNLAIAIIPFTLLYEVPGISTSSDRDFEWSYLYAQQLLMLCSVMEWWRWLRDARQKKTSGLPEGLGAIHIAGLLFVAHAMTGYMRLLVVGH